MSVIHAPKRPELDARALVFPIVLGTALFILFLRLWYYQVLRSMDYSERGGSRRYSEVVKLAPRGLIFDRNGTLVAGIRPELVITVVPKTVKKNPEILDRVAQLLGPGVTREKLEYRLRDTKARQYLPVVVYQGASVEAAAKIAEAGDDLPDVHVETQPMRAYPDSVSLCHVLGRVGIPDPADLERIQAQGLEPAPLVGKGGIERACEEVLMGATGTDRIELDSKRRPVRVIEHNRETPGNQVTLTIDLDLQRYALELLKNGHYKGAVVGIDPATGEILCLASNPTFDQSKFYHGISQADHEALRNDPDRPQFNRAISSTNAPGSTFKIVTALAALRTQHFDPGTRYFCAGGMEVGNSFKTCLGHHGSIPFHEAFVRSCNTYFYNLGKVAGKTALEDAAKEFGLGQKPELEIGAAKGIIPTDSFLKKARRPWHLGDTLNFAIGQGYVNTTPLQMANVAAQVANNGVRYRPHLVRETKDRSPGGKVKVSSPEVVSKIEAPGEFWSELKSAMSGVVNSSSGTAGASRLPGITVVGKTGSAEHIAGGKTHAWFIGFAPLEAPKIAFCVFLENVGHGGEYAAPLAHDLLEHYFNRLAKESAKRLPSASASPALPAAPLSR